MERRPEFTIIAGPNGASKSRLGIFYSNVQAFDGDRLAMTLKKEHPDWVSRWIDGTVISTLMKETDNAIENKLNYAFETNFSSNLATHLIQNSKMQDTNQPHLFWTFFQRGLPFTRHAAPSHGRAQRKSGGDRIQLYRRYQACTCLACSLREHSFVDGTSDFGDIIAIHIPKSGKHMITDHPQIWFEKFFKDAFDKLI